jgi:hypothetical protein
MHMPTVNTHGLSSARSQEGRGGGDEAGHRGHVGHGHRRGAILLSVGHVLAVWCVNWGQVG